MKMLTTTLRLPQTYLDRIKALIPICEKAFPDRGVGSISDVFRMAISRGLDSLEEELGGSPEE